MENYINQNWENFSSELDCKFTKSKIRNHILLLKNNKASSLDKISSEMLKAGATSLTEPLIILRGKLVKNCKKENLVSA